MFIGIYTFNKVWDEINLLSIINPLNSMCWA